VGELVCTDNDDWIDYRGYISLCYGDEEECLTVQFKGTDTKGAKAVLLIDRSWDKRELTLIRYNGETKKYEGREVDWTVKIVDLAGSDTNSKAKLEICYEEPVYCPPAIAAITSNSTYEPASGEEVTFTGYAYGGIDHEVTSRWWYFDGVATTEDEDATHTWLNNTDSPVDHEIKLDVRNDCGNQDVATTIVTVQPAFKRTGIEIQLSDTLNGKDLIAYKAVHTLGDLWWTGPAVVDDILWSGGRCAWGDINSSSKYMVTVGDPCPERNPIDGILPEDPGLCGGEFGDGDQLIILARNPGFDFRIYSSNNLHTLSSSTFNVIYLDSTSGDVIDEAFTGKVCGWLGLASGSECDAFWAEFYDPIFVANYLEIQATGKDMFGNERELGWIDHASFIASLIGSIPLLNIIPLGTVTRNILTATAEIVAKIGDLTGDALSKAGGSLADVCMNAPNAVQEMTAEALADFRAALVKVYGDVQGNKYVDDALAAGRTLVDEAYELVNHADASAADLATFDQLLTDNAGLGGELTTKYKNALTGTPVDGVEAAINNHAASSHTGDIIGMYTSAAIAVKDVFARKVNLFKRIGDDHDLITSAEGAAKAEQWVKSWAKTEQSILRQPTHTAAGVPDALDEYTHLGHVLADDLPEKIAKVPDNFADNSMGDWQDSARDSAQSFGSACWEIWGAMKESAKLSNVEKMALLSLGFATVVLGGIYRYTAGSNEVQAKYAITQAQFTYDLDQLYWACDKAEDDERWDDLTDLIADYTDTIKEATKDLAEREDVLKEAGTYPDFAKALELHQFNINHFISVLDAATDTGALKVSANVKGFDAQLDGTGDLVSDWQSGTVIFNGVPTGEHHAFILKGGYTSCTTPSGTVTAGGITDVRCDLAPGGCVLPVPKIDAPLTGVAMTGIQFKSSATTESEITWLEWDFGDGDQSRQQNPSHLFWNAIPHLIQLTVTDDCGTVTVSYTIEITAAAGEAPGEPTPTDTPNPDLPAGTATVAVKRPINAENGAAIVWPVDVFIHIDGQYSGEEAPHPFSFGGWKELPIGKHTFKVVAEGFQDKEVEIDLIEGDEIDWIAHMDPVGYVPPVDPPVVDPPVVDPPAAGEFAIEFLIPPGATMTISPKTTVSRTIVRSTFTENLRRLSER